MHSNHNNKSFELIIFISRSDCQNVRDEKANANERAKNRYKSFFFHMYIYFQFEFISKR